MTLLKASEVRAVLEAVGLPPFSEFRVYSMEISVSAVGAGPGFEPGAPEDKTGMLPLHHPAGSVRTPQQIIRDLDAEAAHIIDQTVFHLELAAVPVFQPPVICIELLCLMLQLGDLPPQLLDLF